MDIALEKAIVTLLDQLPAGASISPSDAAAAVDSGAWRELAEPARAAARRLMNVGAVEVIQHGHIVDPSTAKGPIRIRYRS